jgi:hypothetical protein
VLSRYVRTDPTKGNERAGRVDLANNHNHVQWIVCRCSCRASGGRARLERRDCWFFFSLFFFIKKKDAALPRENARSVLVPSFEIQCPKTAEFRLGPGWLKAVGARVSTLGVVGGCGGGCYWMAGFALPQSTLRQSNYLPSDDDDAAGKRTGRGTDGRIRDGRTRRSKAEMGKGRDAE